MRISDWSSDVCSSNLVSGDVGASVELHAEAFEQALGVRSEEAHGQEHELALDLLVAALDLLEAAVDHLHLVEAQGPHGAVVVAQEALGVDRVHPLATLLVGGGDLVDHRVDRKSTRLNSSH